jgi:PAS domain S-box-containing protein
MNQHSTELDSLQIKYGLIDQDPTGEIQSPILVFAQRYQAFFNSTNDAIAIFNSRGEVLDANLQLLSLSGYSYDAIVSKSFIDIIDENYQDRISGRFQILMEGRRRRYPIECELITSTARRITVEISFSLMKNQYGYSKTILAVMRDITKRKEIESHLFQRAEELQRVFDAVPTILLVLDTRKQIRSANRAGLEAFRKQEIQVIGKRIGEALDCVHRNDADRGCGYGKTCRKCRVRESLLRCFKVGEAVLGVEQAIDRERYKKPTYYFKMNVIPLETRGKRWGVLSLEDITARKSSELETIQLNEKITKANLELKKTLENLVRSQSQLIESQKLEQIGLLSSGLAHNLKSPLSGIKGYAQLFQMSHGSFKEITIIIQEVEVMESIINNLMLKSRKDHENKDEIININDLLHIELEFLSANMFYKYRVETQIELDEQLPSVSGVYSHFSQVIMNVIQNALDAMHATVQRKMTIRTRHDKESIYIDVVDTGSGILEKDLDSIFNVFFTTKPSLNERTGEEPFGTGLGLSNANYFVHQYGGEITVRSKAGEGTEVTIRYPHLERQGEDKKSCVLVVDDSEAFVDVVTRICQESGIKAFGVTSGAKALDLYKKCKPHVVITDLFMPGLTGPELVAKIRKINPGQRIIYISGYGDNPEFKEWIEKEKEDFPDNVLLPKPLSLDDFRNVLGKMVCNTEDKPKR